MPAIRTPCGQAKGNQHRPRHAQQQVLQLMHEEQVLHQGIDRQLQRQEHHREANNERQVPPAGDRLRDSATADIATP